MKNFATAKALISFWGWICIVLLSFLLAVVSLVSGEVPVAVVFVVSAVIFAVSLAVIIINPGIFAKQHSVDTGK